MQLRRARQQGPTRTLTAKKCNKTVTGRHWPSPSQFVTSERNKNMPCISWCLPFHQFSLKDRQTDTHAHAHTHTQPFNGPLSGTTWVGRYINNNSNKQIVQCHKAVTSEALTPILIIGHPLSTSSIYYDPQHPLYSLLFDNLFPSNLLTNLWIRKATNTHNLKPGHVNRVCTAENCMNKTKFKRLITKNVNKRPW